MAQQVTRITTWTCDQCAKQCQVNDDPVAPADWVYVGADGHSVWFEQTACAVAWLKAHQAAGRPELDINLPPEEADAS